MLSLLIPAIENLEVLSDAIIKTCPEFKVSSFERLSKICAQLFKMESDSRDFKRIFADEHIETEQHNQSIDLKKLK